MQNQSFQSNTERNNAKFLHVDVLFIYLFLFSQCHLSHNTEENKKMTLLATAFQTLLHHQLSRYCIYIYICPYSPQATTHLRGQDQSELQQWHRNKVAGNHISSLKRLPRAEQVCSSLTHQNHSQKEAFLFLSCGLFFFFNTHSNRIQHRGLKFQYAC